jgi:hypothetical protein
VLEAQQSEDAVLWLEELTSNPSSSVQDTNNLYPIVDWAVEDEVLTNRGYTGSGGKSVHGDPIPGNAAKVRQRSRMLSIKRSAAVGLSAAIYSQIASRSASAAGRRTGCVIAKCRINALKVLRGPVFSPPQRPGHQTVAQARSLIPFEFPPAALPASSLKEGSQGALPQ